MCTAINVARDFFTENRELVLSEGRIVGEVLLFVRKWAFLILLLSAVVTLVSWQIQLEGISLGVMIEWARSKSFVALGFALAVTLPISFREDANTGGE